MKKVSDLQVGASVGAAEMLLPAEIQEALGELVGSARDGLLALSVGPGLSLMSRLMEFEVERLAGSKGRHDPGRVAKRHGYEQGSVTLGGRRVTIRRPRVRSADDERERPLATYEYFASRDPLTRAVMDRMLAGVSTRRYVKVGEPVGQEVEREASATSKSTVSELFIESTRTALGELMARRLDDLRLAVMMIDGMEIAERTHVVALGITTDGVKIPLGLWEGSTENATVARELHRRSGRAGPRSRAGDPVRDRWRQGTLRRAIKDVFGERALVHRCHRHKERNVTDQLPEGERDRIRARMRQAWALTNYRQARQRLGQLVVELERTWPDAARSLQEGLEETLTLTRLGVAGQLAKTLSSTNPCESMIEIVRRTQRNVKRWREGDMRKRWTAAGMLEAEQQFRRIIGYRHLATLVIAIERHALRANVDKHVTEPAEESRVAPLEKEVVLPRTV
jgi:putative transposase